MPSDLQAPKSASSNPGTEPGSNPNGQSRRLPRRRPRRSLADRVDIALTMLSEAKGQIVSHVEKPWASITFSGTRHELEMLFEGESAIPSAERFIAELPDHEFTIPGQLVADAAIIAVDHAMLPRERMLIKANLLLLEER